MLHMCVWPCIVGALTTGFAQFMCRIVSVNAVGGSFRFCFFTLFPYTTLFFFEQKRAEEVVIGD